MNWWFLLAMLVFALLGLAFFIARLREEAKMYRLLWIDVGRKLEFAIGERNEYINTTLAVAEDCAALRLIRAKLNKLHTQDAKRIDSLLHGDRSCVLGHRYWTGEGISCPHCNAAERRFKIPEPSPVEKMRGRTGTVVIACDADSAPGMIGYPPPDLRFKETESGIEVEAITLPRIVI